MSLTWLWQHQIAPHCIKLNCAQLSAPSKNAEISNPAPLCSLVLFMSECSFEMNDYCSVSLSVSLMVWAFIYRDCHSCCQSWTLRKKKVSSCVCVERLSHFLLFGRFSLMFSNWVRLPCPFIWRDPEWAQVECILCSKSSLREKLSLSPGELKGCLIICAFTAADSELT